ncbi:MAG: O-antigen ligase domain-containing protein [Chloroflexi bacterium]|nr:MAG: O-antigen ligase domain-containing protein [Chloroflexota bacterium]
MKQNKLLDNLNQNQIIIISTIIIVFLISFIILINKFPLMQIPIIIALIGGIWILIQSPTRFLRIFVWAYPLYLFLQAFLFPSMKDRTNNGLFPAIPVAGINLRLDELLLLVAIFLFFSKYIFMLIQSKNKWSFQVATLLIFAFLAFYSIGGIHGIIARNPNAFSDIRYSLLPAIYLFMFIKLFDPDLHLEQVRKWSMILLAILSFSSLLSALFPEYVSLLQRLPFPNARPKGTSSIVEVLTMLKIIYALALAGFLNRDSPRYVYLFLVLLAIAGQLIWVDKTTYVQIPLITLLVIVALSYKSLFRWRTQIAQRAFFVGIFVIVVTLVFIFLLSNEFVVNYIEYAVFRITRPDIGDVTSRRVTLWIEALNLIWKNPFFGNGMGIVYTFPALINPDYLVTMQEHNMFLWVAVRLGIPAFIILCLLIIWYIGIGFRLVGKLHGKEKSTAVAMFAFSTSMIIMSFTGMHLLHFNVGILFMTSIGIIGKMYICEFRQTLEERN